MMIVILFVVETSIFLSVYIPPISTHCKPSLIKKNLSERVILNSVTPFLDQSKHNGCHYYFRFCDGNKGCLNKPAIDNVSDDTLFSKNKSLCKFLCHLRTYQKSQ